MPPQSRFEEDMTLLQHVAEDDHVLGAVVPPIFQTSLFVFDDLDQFQLGYTGKSDSHAYSRITNPTVQILEDKIAALERAEAALVFSSGMAAVTCAVMSAVKKGSHIVLVDTIYGPAKRFICSYLAEWGVTHTLVDGRCTDEIIAAIKPETSLVYLESPSSLLFRMQDIEAVVKECKQRGITTCIDNTYGLSIQYPIELGVDLTIHSASKAISGHSDVIAGAVCGSKDRMHKMRTHELELFGSIIAPLPAYLLIRGLRTLPLRLARTRETANTVAAYVKGLAEVEQVYHLGDPDYCQRPLFEKQMTGSACIFSFLPRTNDRAKVKKFVEGLRVFRMGVSWGGHESLVVVSKCHPMDWKEDRHVIRFCCGFESADDLIKDIEQALPHLA